VRRSNHISGHWLSAMDAQCDGRLVYVLRHNGNGFEALSRYPASEVESWEIIEHPNPTPSP